MKRKKTLMKIVLFVTMLFYILILSGKLTDIPAGTSERGFYNMKYGGLILFLGFVFGILINKYYPNPKKDIWLKTMKKKIEFRINLLEMILFFAMIFSGGVFFSSDMNDKFVYSGLLIFSAGILILKKRYRKGWFQVEKCFSTRIKWF